MKFIGTRTLGMARGKELVNCVSLSGYIVTISKIENKKREAKIASLLWLSKAQVLSQKGFKVRVSKLLEIATNLEQKKSGFDLVDFFTN